MLFRVFFLITFMLGGAFTGWAKPTVVATTADLAALAKEVGGDLISVKSLIRGHENPHDIEGKSTYVSLLSRADLLLQVGLGLESEWLPALILQSKNNKIKSGQAGYLDASSGISILDVPSEKTEGLEEDLHPQGNPHYWLDPRNGILIAGSIAERLSDLDPANEVHYMANYHAFESKMKAKIKEWKSALSSRKGAPLIAYHKSFTYFSEWAGLKIMDYIEPKPGVPPPPAHIISLIELIKTEHIPLIISEAVYESKSAVQLAKKTGANLLILPSSVGGIKGIHDYSAFFDYLISRLKISTN